MNWDWFLIHGLGLISSSGIIRLIPKRIVSPSKPFCVLVILIIGFNIKHRCGVTILVVDNH
jgi:hypothetical protein